jgi:hypothetical protein
MKARILAVALMAASLSAATLARQQPAAPAATFERPVITRGRGPHKLPVDVTLMSGAQPFVRAGDKASGFSADGLADLRLVDAQGREIGYLLITPSYRRTWLNGVIRPILPTEKKSGFEFDLGEVRLIDMFDLDALPAPFMKRAIIEGSGDGTRWNLVGQATLFDLPQERLRQTSVGFMPTPYRYLRVTWDDANSVRLPMPRRVTVRQALRRTAPVPDRAAVPSVRQASEPGRSRYRVRLPAIGLPIVALALDVGTADVFRTASVSEPRFNGERADPVELGRERLVRSEDDASEHAPLRIYIETPRSTELQLVIEDGNNAPLDIKGAFVEFATLPWIYFDAPEGPVIARYGDRSARAPEYDLEAKRASIDLDTVPEAAWGEPRASARAAPAAAPPSLPDRGAPVVLSGFRYQRPIPSRTRSEASVADGTLVALKLDAAALAHSRGPGGRFSDVRIVDDRENQIPYLLERRDEPLSIDVPIRQATPRVASLTDRQGNRSFYSVTLPYETLPNPQLVIETSDRVFRRTVQIGVERAPDRRRRDGSFDVLSSSVWQHADQTLPAQPLNVAVDRAAATDLLIVIEEGDNRPLALTAVRVLLPAWRVRFFRPDAPLRLVYGHDEMRAPQYDLALLAPAVMGAEALEIEAGAEAPAAAKTTALLSPRVFWIGLGLAVIVLLALIVRLVTSETPPPSAGQV